MERLTQYIKSRVEELESLKEAFRSNLQEFSNLDTKLKARKSKGEKLDKSDQEVQALFALGSKLGWSVDNPHIPDKDLHFQTGIEELNKVLSLLEGNKVIV